MGKPRVSGALLAASLALAVAPGAQAAPNTANVSMNTLTFNLVEVGSTNDINNMRVDTKGTAAPDDDELVHGVALTAVAADARAVAARSSPARR